MTLKLPIKKLTQVTKQFFGLTCVAFYALDLKYIFSTLSELYAFVYLMTNRFIDNEKKNRALCFDMGETGETVKAVKSIRLVHLSIRCIFVLILEKHPLALAHFHLYVHISELGSLLNA